MTFFKKKKFEKWDLLYIIRECMCKFKDMAGKGLLKWSDQISESI